LKANVELWKEKKDHFVAETKEMTEELKEKTDQYIKEKKEKLAETKERMRDRKDLFVLETRERTEQYIKEKREKLNETKERIRERKEKLMARPGIQASVCNSLSLSPLHKTTTTLPPQMPNLNCL